MSLTLALDPGKSWGWCFGTYSETEPWKILEYGQETGGLDSFDVWFHSGMPDIGAVEFIVEKFVLLNNKFVADIEPKAFEGYLKAMHIEPIYQRATSLVLVGGDDAPDRKKRSDDVLRAGGLWRTGKEFGVKDANDYHSSIKHTLWYMKNTLKHEPTIRKYWPQDEPS